MKHCCSIGVWLPILESSAQPMDADLERSPHLPTACSAAIHLSALALLLVVDKSTTPSTNAPGSQAGDVSAVVQVVSPFTGLGGLQRFPA